MVSFNLHDEKDAETIELFNKTLKDDLGYYKKGNKKKALVYMIGLYRKDVDARIKKDLADERRGP
jgi:hypothetical protein